MQLNPALRVSGRGRCQINLRCAISTFQDSTISEEKQMHSILSKSLFPLAIGATLLLGGCVTKDDLAKVQASADRAQSTADRAQSSADQANSAAQRAQQTADKAQSGADQANAAAQKADSDAKAVSDKLDEMNAKRGKRVRGERG
jgi:methyl-accepting chemotaxis protein